MKLQAKLPDVKILETTSYFEPNALGTICLNFENSGCLCSLCEKTGWFSADLVRRTFESSDGPITICGAVDDNGLANGSAPNVVASVIFRQLLVGGCALFKEVDTPDGDKDLKPFLFSDLSEDDVKKLIED